MIILVKLFIFIVLLIFLATELIKIKRKGVGYSIYKAVAIAFLVVAMGLYLFIPMNKSVPMENVETNGMEQMTLQESDVPNEAEIEKDAEKKKNKFLKRQDEGPGKDIEEADEYLRKTLERAKKLQ